MRILRKVLRAIAIVPVLGCTPLGVWIYDDPRFTVSRVRLGSDSLSVAPLLVGLKVQNINDYPLAAVRIQLAVELDSLPIGKLDQDSTMVLVQEATSDVALPVLPSAGVSAGRLAALSWGAHRFLVTGKAQITTPFGKREIRFAQEGDLEFGSVDSTTALRVFAPERSLDSQ